MKRKKIRRGDVVSFFMKKTVCYFIALTDEHNGNIIGLCRSGNTKVFHANEASKIEINTKISFEVLIPLLEILDINEDNGLLQLLNLEDDLDDDDDDDDDDEGNLWDNVKVTYEYSQPKIEIRVANI